MTDPIRHGWWSDNQASLCGYSIYETPQGTKVKVTAVTNGPTHDMGWHDVRYVGQVTKWVSNHHGYGYTYKSAGPRMPVTDQSGSMQDPPVEPQKAAPEPPKEETCKRKYYGIGDCTCGKCPKRKW